MLLITAINVFGIVIFVVILFFAARWFNTPKAGTRSLVMAVWAAFGPYRTVEDAEDMFRRASRAVFGQQGIGKQEKWIEDYIQGFHDWQTKGRFDRAQKLIRASVMLTAYGKAFETAFKQVKLEAADDCQNAAEKLNKDILEKGGHRLEVVKKDDGTAQLVYKQIWSDEEIKQNERKTGENIIRAFGNSLMTDKSVEAITLLLFLGSAHPTNLSDPMDVGRM